MDQKFLSLTNWIRFLTKGSGISDPQQKGSGISDPQQKGSEFPDP